MVITFPLFKGWKIRQKCENFFINQDLVKNVYMTQPLGHEYGPGLVCRLKRQYMGSNKPQELRIKSFVHAWKP